MTRRTPHVGVPFLEPSGWPDRVHVAGAEPVPLRLPSFRPRGGVALAREWVADTMEISCAEAGLDALLLDAKTPEELFGMILAAVRLDLPTLCAPPVDTPVAAALTALGLAPPGAKDTAGLAANGVPLPSCLLDNFSLANALRAGISAGGGPELVVHLSALAREAGVVGFAQMARVLAPETAVRPGSWTAEHGVPALLASLGDALHDIPTVSGRLKEGLPGGVDDSDATRRFAPLRARSSGAEAMGVAPAGVSEVSGACRVFLSERDAVLAAEGDGVRGDVLVVAGCGPRGGPGLVRLDALAGALRGVGAPAAVITDGTAPEDAPGVWASLFTPEAAAGGILGRLRDGDALRLDLAEGRIRSEVRREELLARQPLRPASSAGAGYTARYARSALVALEGAAFG